MNTITSIFSRLKIITFSILIIVVIFSPAFPRFYWYGSRDKIYQTARVYLKNGNMLSGFIKMYYKNTAGKDNVSLIDIEGRKLRPFETDSVIINSLAGISNDTVWLFKIIEGKISVYNTKPVRDSEFYTHVQKEGTGICAYTPDLLKEYLKDNEYALKLFMRYRDSKSKVLIDYTPKRAILEYNVQSVTKRMRAEDLLSFVKKEKNIEQKIAHCKEIISLDSTIFEPYLLLGDYEAQKGNSEEAYLYYTQYQRYCPSVNTPGPIREKIQALGKEPVY